MKFKVSMKNMQGCHYKIVSAGYCSMQYLLKGKEPIAYSSGRYGWSCDYYIVDDVLICTGYRTIKGTVKVDYDKLRECEEKARQEYQYQYGLYFTPEELITRSNTLLKQFIKETLTEVKQNG